MTDISDPAPAASSEEALIDAVMQLWVSEPGLSAKAVHSKLSAETLWTNVTQGEVKKACSKAMKRRGGGANGAATGGSQKAAVSSAITFTDSPSSQLSKKLAGMDVCDEFAAALWKRLTGDKQRKRADTPIPPSGLFECLKKQQPAAGSRSACWLSLGQIGHDLLLELATDSTNGDELRARPFSAWVFSVGGDELNEGANALSKDTRRVQRKAGARGYRASEWAADQARCRWMRESELRDWCASLGRLRSLVEALTERHLRHCTPEGLGATHRRQWASAICANAAQDGIMVQPGAIDEQTLKDYRKQLARSGISNAHMVVFRLIGNSMANAEQLLDFPLQDGVDVANLVCELFGEVPGSFSWLRMLEFEALPIGWAFSIAGCVSDADSK